MKDQSLTNVNPTRQLPFQPLASSPPSPDPDPPTQSALRQQRLPLLSWIIIPVVGLWLTLNYFMGLNRRVDWKLLPQPDQTVLGSQAENPPPPPNYQWDGNGLITLWFDDAWYSQYSLALPTLDSWGMVGALAVPTNYVSGNSYMSWAQIKRLQFKGWEITSHGVNHICDSDQLSDEIIKFELGESLRALRKHGLDIGIFVTPCGTKSDRYGEYAREEYLSLRTAMEGLNPLPITNPYSLKIKAVKNTTSLSDFNRWLKQAETEKSWVIPVFHQIGYENNQYEVTPELFKQMIRLVKKSRLSVVLPSQALQVSLAP